MLGVYVYKFGKKGVAWRHTLQSIEPSDIALEYAYNYDDQTRFTFIMPLKWVAIIGYM